MTLALYSLEKIPLYIFSGLGIDERIFRNIRFEEFSEPHFIRWKKPLPKETLGEYVDRLVKEIDLSKPVVLLGLSFGGMIAQEVAKKIHPLRTIIISSIASPAEIPWYFRLAGKIKLNRIVPFGMMKMTSAGMNWIFGAKRAEDKKLMSEIIRDADSSLLKWSVDRLLSWKSNSPPENFIHIHGDHDKLLPRKNKNSIVVKDGTHLMIYNKAEEIENILREILSKES